MDEKSADALLGHFPDLADDRFWVHITVPKPERNQAICSGWGAKEEINVNLLFSMSPLRKLLVF
jgi:hypothetical protein